MYCCKHNSDNHNPKCGIMIKQIKCIQSKHQHPLQYPYEHVSNAAGPEFPCSGLSHTDTAGCGCGKRLDGYLSKTRITLLTTSCWVCTGINLTWHGMCRRCMSRQLSRKTGWLRAGPFGSWAVCWETRASSRMLKCPCVMPWPSWNLNWAVTTWTLPKLAMVCLFYTRPSFDLPPRFSECLY